MSDIMLVSSVLGIVSGLLAGLFGIGGGLVIVPVLAVLFKAHGFSADLIMIMAVATSLAVISFTAVSSVWAHHRLGSVIWLKVVRLVPGIIVGSALGYGIGKYIVKNHKQTKWFLFPSQSGGCLMVTGIYRF